ncbi:helix-turn-helix domain-containing protein [Aidingimonas lacisalsi]|uniref:helix-turn-helix domain-containing protein n=1 Tax=Aidingimonas lacisalsi TaxID=2604086 RepID=UPI0011D2AEEB|nr:AraC family transcriptional regulator [Aidingimonas lacisalsi]
MRGMPLLSMSTSDTVMNTSYLTVVPQPPLADYIAGIWIQQAGVVASHADNTPTRVVPTGVAEMTFQFGDPMWELGMGAMPRSTFNGQKTRFKEYRATGTTGLLIVRFKPWAAAAFLPQPLHELEDLNVDLATLVDKDLVDRLGDALLQADFDSARIALVEGFLLTLLRTYNARLDPVARSAIHHIVEAEGTLRIGHLSERLGLGLRQFQQRFRAGVGLTPKGFSSIVRFQSALADSASYQDTYYDQSHFIHASRRLVGVTPTALQALRRASALGCHFNRPAHFYNTVYLRPDYDDSVR